jgi:predicted Zn finger-like uncharacterized protein
MYVQCERCKTEYDFDDALVSERGTTVKCTQCGHQFKVRRAAAPDGASDRWVVTTVSGKTLVFTSLRELQKAILGKQVARSDSLQRGSGPPRLLGAIAELEPFFDKRASVPPGKADLADVEPQTNRRPSSRPAASLPTPTPPPPVRPRIDTLRPDGAPPPNASSALQSTLSAVNTAEPFAPRPVQQEISATVPAFVPSAVPPQPQPQPALHGTMPMAPVARPIVATPAPAPVLSSPLPPPMRPRQESAYPAHPSIPDETYAPPRRRVGGWIVALVLVGGVSVLGFVVAKPYLMHPTKPAATLAPLDPKAQQLLSDGERAFADGNLDSAKESFDKASVLADKDPRVLLDVARVAEARADVAWLGMKLAVAGEPQVRARKELDELSVKSSGAADAALAVTPDDPPAVRSKIDALRIAGDLAQARALVAKMQTSAIGSQPETEYVLATLDLAETTSAPTTQVLERLRDAAQSEGNLGRARAMLVYAMARAGDAAGARRELEKLLGLPRQHPLQSELRAFVDHAAQASGDAGSVAVVDVNTLPQNGGGGGGGGSGGGGADPRSLNQQADNARAHGDYAKAKELYGKVLAASPTDSEALAGLGDCSYASRDLDNAKTYYQRALAANNTYTPALIGLADTLWDEGDKAGAQKRYKDIVDRLPDSMVPARVKSRATEGAPTPQPTATGDKE